jgi:hypothetical protein
MMFGIAAVWPALRRLATRAAIAVLRRRASASFAHALT